MDTGRQDAAPHGGGGSGAGPTVAASTYRSDNNFGTSSTVPGDPRAGKGANGARGGGGGAAAGGAALVAARAITDTGDPSEPLGMALLLVLVGVGALLGVIAARSRSRATS